MTDLKNEKMLEPAAFSNAYSLEGMTALSIAISLKRIADRLEITTDMVASGMEPSRLASYIRDAAIQIKAAGVDQI